MHNVVKFHDDAGYERSLFVAAFVISTANSILGKRTLIFDVILILSYCFKLKVQVSGYNCHKLL